MKLRGGEGESGGKPRDPCDTRQPEKLCFGELREDATI